MGALFNKLSIQGQPRQTGHHVNHRSQWACTHGAPQIKGLANHASSPSPALPCSEGYHYSAETGCQGPTDPALPNPHANFLALPGPPRKTKSGSQEGNRQCLHLGDLREVVCDQHTGSQGLHLERGLVSSSWTGSVQVTWHQAAVNILLECFWMTTLLLLCGIHDNHLGSASESQSSVASPG